MKIKLLRPRVLQTIFKNLLCAHFIFSHMHVSAETARTSSLSLTDYLDQVRTSHQGYQAASIRSRSFLGEAGVAKIALSPHAFASAQWINDSKPVSSIPNFGDQTETKLYSFGVSKLFEFGTQTKLTYQIEKTDITAVSAAANPEPHYFQNFVRFELSQSLWRNFFGSETRAMIELTEAEKFEVSFNERFRMKNLLAAAEAAYWKAYAAQRTLLVRENSKARAQKLSDWSEERARLHLADRSDFLQAQAALAARELELKSAKESLVSASITFNSMRGIETPEIRESLEGLRREDIAELAPPARASLRDDTLAAKERARIARSSSQFTLEKARPNLDLMGSLAFAGRNPSMSSATSDSFSNDHPVFTLGIQLTTPVDFWNLNHILDSAAASQRAADFDFERKVFEQEREWADLSNQFQSTKEQLILARELEKIQSEKLNYEQERLKKGRTTTFQVLTFEQDYASARLNSIFTETELLSLYAQMKIFSMGVPQ